MNFNNYRINNGLTAIDLKIYIKLNKFVNYLL